jgi:hypothetical protein
MASAAARPALSTCELSFKEADGVTKSSDKDPLEALRRANQTPLPPKRAADLVPYDYYSSHPEHKPRRPTRRRLRRRLIREG